MSSLDKIIRWQYNVVIMDYIILDDSILMLIQKHPCSKYIANDECLNAI